MTDSKIEIVHYNRKGEKIDLCSDDNKNHIKEIVVNVIKKTLEE